MWLHHTIKLLLLAIAYVNSSPSWVYNTGLDDASSEFRCLSFTKVYDPYTGHITYRCNNPSQKNGNSLSVPNGLLSDKESNEDIYPIPVSFQSSGSSKNTDSKPIHQSITPGRTQLKNKNKSNKKPKRPTNSRRNRCPPGQMFQSELDICIDYPLGAPLPPKRPSNNRQTMFDGMLGDAPLRLTSAHQSSPAAGTVISVGKFNMKNRCKPNEIFVSELGICLPKNNCYPYGRTC